MISPTISLKTDCDALIKSQREMGDLLLSVAEHQDWQPAPDEWSIRYIAAHMRQVDIDCLWNRVMRISAGENPSYSYYYNTGWDFGRFDIQQSVQEWASWRQWVVDFVLKLEPEQLTYTGNHTYFGPITIPRMLEISLEHDREHFLHLQQILAILNNK